MTSEYDMHDLVELEQVAASRPDSAEAMQSLADAYADLGRWHDAARAYRAAINLEPANEDLYNSLATLGLQRHRPEWPHDTHV